MLLESSWAGPEPAVRVRRDGERTSHHIPLLGLQLQYQLDDQSKRFCLGHRAFGSKGSEYIDCLRPPKPGAKKCVRCAVHDATFASNIHHAHTKDRSGIDRFFAQHLAKPNVLYLAAFRDGSIKVGTSTEERMNHRLAEQGAWVAQIVARSDDGFVVREIEDLVTEFVGLAQAVSARRKLAGFLQPVADASLEQVLATHAVKVVGLVDALNDERLTSMNQGWQFPTRSDPAWQSPVRYPLAVDSGSHHLTVVAACGRTLGCQRQLPDGTIESETYLVDVGDLYGKQLLLGQFDSDEVSLQKSLF